jgi:hypothetical protein
MSRDALFDLAVNRALVYAQRLGLVPAPPHAPQLQEGLRAWYLRTRFAYRVPLEEVVARLERYPGAGHYWSGGPDGVWVPGENPFP